MALNYWHQPMENFVQGGSQDRDIGELLPADPFGMDISSTVTALTGWLEELHLQAKYGCGYQVDNNAGGGGVADVPVFASWNFLCNAAAMEFQARQHGGTSFDESSVCGFLPSEEESWSRCLGSDGGVRFSCNLDGAEFGSNDIRGGSYDSYGNASKPESGLPVYDRGLPLLVDLTLEEDWGVHNDVGVHWHGDGGNTNNDEEIADDGYVLHSELGPPVYDEGSSLPVDQRMEEVRHMALSLALGYLGVRDLLSVEMVCKSLRDTVQNDCLLWRHIHIDQPLNDRITDEALVRLSNRAQGRLHCLSLAVCKNITDDGVRRVLNDNPKLVKLSVPGCVKVSIDGVVNILKAFQEGAVTGIKHLRVGGLYGVTPKHFEELMSLMGIDDNHAQVNRNKPHFFSRDTVYISYEDDRPIDIERCPNCPNLRIVYNCPAECCQTNDLSTQICRACIHCIARCFECGKCVKDGKYEETFCLETICSDCWNEGLQSKEGQDVGTSPCDHAISEEPAIFFYG